METSRLNRVPSDMQTLKNSTSPSVRVVAGSLNNDKCTIRSKIGGVTNDFWTYKGQKNLLIDSCSDIRIIVEKSYEEASINDCSSCIIIFNNVVNKINITKSETITFEFKANELEHVQNKQDEIEHLKNELRKFQSNN